MANSEFTFNQACDEIGDCLSSANLSFGHGAPDADSEALWILSHCLNISPMEALDQLDDPYPNGSLAILMAIHYPDIQVTATDISASALELASLNINKYELNQKVNLFCGDLFEALPSHSDADKFDIILCNPPYVNESSMNRLPKEYLHEPNIALAGGSDGMSIVKQIIFQAKNYLKKGGVIIIEIGNEYENFQQSLPELSVEWLEVSSGNQHVLLIYDNDLP